MNRKLIAGVAAALLVPATLGAVSAEATSAQKPTITSVTFTNLATYPNAWGSGGAGGSGSSHYTAQPNTSLSPYEEATMTIHGTNLGSSTAPSQVGFVDKTRAIIGLSTGSSAPMCPTDGNFATGSSPTTADAGICISKGAVNTNTGTVFTATVYGPQGDSLFMLQKKGISTYYPGALEVDFTPTGGSTAKYKGTDTIDSNCGTTLPAAAASGKSYTLDANGEPTGAGATSVATTYADVSLNVLDGAIVGNLCTPDIGTAAAGPTAPNTVDYPAYAVNYPVSWQTSSSTGSDTAGGAHTFKGVSFGFPYTSDQELDIYGVTQTYTLTNFNKHLSYSCAAASTGQPSGLVAAHINCTISTKGVVTITDNADDTKYNAGDTISGPVVDITAHGTSAGTMTLEAGADSSEIGLGGTCTLSSGTWTAHGGGLCAAVVFGPRAGTANATYAPLSN